MAELEEKLNAILNDPQAMGQILSAAKVLSGQEESPAAQAEEPAESGADPLSALGQLDPRLLQLGMRLLSDYSGGDDRKTALLEALKPFLRPKRQARVDQAVRIARLTGMVRSALQFFREQREEADDV